VQCVDILNRFDEVLENAIHSSSILTLGDTIKPTQQHEKTSTTTLNRKSSTGSATTPSKAATTITATTTTTTPHADLLIKILKLTTFLLDTCRGKNLYNSLDHVVALLNSENLDVVLSATNLLYTIVRKDPYSNAIAFEANKHALSKLLSLSYGYGPNSILLTCREGSNLSEEIVAKGSSVHFEFYSDTYAKDRSSKRQRSNSKRSSLGSAASARVIDLKDVDKESNEELFKTFLQLVKSQHVPGDQKFALWTRIRLANAFSNSQARCLLTQIRLKALSTLSHGTQSQDYLPTFLRHQPEIATELRDVLEDGVESLPSEIVISTMEVLASLVLSRTKIINVVSELIPTGSSAFNGVLPKVLNGITESFSATSSESDRDYKLYKAFFRLITALGSVPAGAKAIYDAGIFHEIVGLLSIAKTQSEVVTDECLKVVEQLAAPDHQRANVLQSSTLHEVLSVLNSTFEPCLKECQEKEQMQVEEMKRTVKDVLSTLQLSILQHAFRILHAAMRTRNGDVNARDILEGEQGILKVINCTLQHVEFFDSFFFSYSASIVSQLLNLEPTCITLVIRSGTLKIILDLLKVGPPVNADTIYAIPPLMSVISLNPQGLEEIKNDNGIHNLYKILIDPKYNKILTRDGAVLLGKDLFDFIRQHVSLRESSIEMMIGFLKELLEKAEKEPILFQIPPDANEISEEGIAFTKTASNLIKAMGSMIQTNADNGRIFIEKEGLKTLISLGSRAINRSKTSREILNSMMSTLRSLCRNHSALVFKELVDTMADQINVLAPDPNDIDIDFENSEVLNSLSVISSMLQLTFSLFNQTNAPFLQDWSRSKGKDLLPPLGKLDTSVRWKLAQNLNVEKPPEEPVPDHDKKKKKVQAKGEASPTTTTDSGSSEPTSEKKQVDLVTPVLSSFVIGIHQLYDTLQKAIFYGVKQFEGRGNAGSQAPSQPARQLANNLSVNLCVPLRSYSTLVSQEGVELDQKCTFMASVFSLIHSVIVSERHKNSNTLILHEFNKEGGIDAILEIYEKLTLEILETKNKQTTSTVVTEPIDEDVKDSAQEVSTTSDQGAPTQSQPKERKLLAKISAQDEFTINSTRFLQKLASLQYIVTSPLTANMLLLDQANGGPFDATAILKSIHKRIARAIISFWQHPRFSDLDSEFMMLFTNVVAHIIKGVEGEDDEQSSLSLLKKQVAPATQIDEMALSNLMEMGFGIGVSKEALRRCQNNVNAAIEFLFNNPGLSVPDEKDDEDDEESEEAIMRRAIQMSLEASSEESEEKGKEKVEVDSIKLLKDSALEWVLDVAQKARSLALPATDILSLLCEKDGDVVVKAISERLNVLASASSESSTEDSQYSKLSCFLNVLGLISNQLTTLRSHLLEKENDLVNMLSGVIRRGLIDAEKVNNAQMDAVSSIFVLFELMSQSPKMSNKSKEDEEKLTVESFVTSMQQGLITEKDQHALLAISIEVLDQHKKINSNVLKNVLKTLANLTLSFDVAQKALEHGLLEKIMALPGDILRYYEFSTQLEVLLKHLVEDDNTLLQAMESYIRRRLPGLAVSHGRVTPVVFLQTFAHRIERNPAIFFKAVKNVCKIRQGSSVIELKEPDSKTTSVTSKPSHTQPMTHVITTLLKALIMTPFFEHEPASTTTTTIGTTVSSVTPTNTTPSKSDKGKAVTRKGSASHLTEQAETHPPALEKHHILKLLADFVTAYKCGDIIVNFANTELLQEHTGSDNIIFYLLKDLLPYPCNPQHKDIVHDVAVRKRYQASRMTGYLLCALCSVNSSEIFDGILRIIEYCNEKDRPFRTIHAIADFINSLLSNKANKIRNVIEELSKIIIDRGIVAALTASLNKIDLNHPDASDVTNAILKPIEFLVRTSNGFKSKNKQKKTETQQTEKKDENVMEEDETEPTPQRVSEIDFDYTAYLNEFSRMETDRQMPIGESYRSVIRTQNIPTSLNALLGGDGDNSESDSESSEEQEHEQEDQDDMEQDEDQQENDEEGDEQEEEMQEARENIIVQDQNEEEEEEGEEGENFDNHEDRGDEQRDEEDDEEVEGGNEGGDDDDDDEGDDFNGGQGEEFIRQFAQSINDEDIDGIENEGLRALTNSLAPSQIRSLLDSLQRAGGGTTQIHIATTDGVTVHRFGQSVMPVEAVSSQYEPVYAPPTAGGAGLFGVRRGGAPRSRYSFAELFSQPDPYSSFGGALGAPGSRQQPAAVPTGLDQALMSLIREERPQSDEKQKKKSGNKLREIEEVRTPTILSRMFGGGGVFEENSPVATTNELNERLNEFERILSGRLQQETSQIERSVSLRETASPISPISLNVSTTSEEPREQVAESSSAMVIDEAVSEPEPVVTSTTAPAPESVQPAIVQNQQTVEQPAQATEQQQTAEMQQQPPTVEATTTAEVQQQPSTVEATTTEQPQASASTSRAPQEFAIDPTFLAALPDEIRQEILVTHIAQLVGTTTDPNAESTISADFLNALPTDIRNEVLEQERILRQSQQRQQAQQTQQNTTNQPQPATGNAGASTAPQGGDMDTATFIASLTPDLRQEVLLTSDESVLMTLPPELAAEAYALRNTYYNRQMRSRRQQQTDNSRTGLLTKTMLSILKEDETAEKEEGEPLLIEDDIVAILRLFYISRSLSKPLILKVLNSLCNHPESRSNILYLLFGVLEHHNTEDSDIPGRLSPLVMNTMFGVSSHAGFNLRGLTPNIPVSVMKRFLDTLVQLAKIPRVLSLLAKPDTDLFALVDKKQKGTLSEEKTKPSIVSKLFSLLSEPYFTTSGKMLEQIMQLLDFCIDYQNKMLKTLKHEIKKSHETVIQLKARIEEKSKSDAQKQEKQGETTTEEQIALITPTKDDNMEIEQEMIEEKTLAPKKKIKKKEEEEKVENLEEQLKKEQEKLQKIVADKEALEKQITSILSSESIRQLVHVLTRPDASETAVKLASSIMNHMSSAVPRIGVTILRELGDVAIAEANQVVDVLSTSSRKAEKSSKGKLPQDAKKLLQELKFCRILKTYSTVMRQEKKKMLAKEQKQKKPPREGSTTLTLDTSARAVDFDSLHYLKEHSLDFVWAALEKYLINVAVAEEHDEDHRMEEAQLQQQRARSSKGGKKQNMALYSSLLPLVEAFFQFHSGFQAEKEDENEVNLSEMISETPTSARLPHSRVEQFLEKNRSFLNDLVRSSPSLLTTSLALLMKHPKYVDFDNKRTWFRAKIHQEQQRSGLGTLPITVRRSNLMADSYNALINRTIEELKDKITVQFASEPAVDAGGVSREWFLLISREMLNPMYGLFIQSTDKTTYQPNPASNVNIDHLSYFKFVGRVIALAIYNEQLLDCYFTRSLYKHILGIPISYHDIESIDPEYYKNLKWMLDNSIEGVVDYTFTQEIEEYGSRKTVELKEGGKNIPVTDENKMEYVKLATELKMTKLIEQQLTAFLSSFFEIIPKELIAVFNEQEIELLMSGLPEIDIEDLNNNTEYQGYSGNSDVIRWFWNVVHSLNTHEKALLLQFVTGTSKVPLDGFKSLLGMSGIQRFNIHRVPGDTDRLPTSHTCFNQLDLPEYASEEILRERLLLAIRIGAESFGIV
jgi:hypothetical protein